MELTVLGCSPSFPNPGGASSGYLLRGDATTVLLECGHGVSSRLPLAVDPREIDAIVISHMHADHFMDLLPLGYAFRFEYPLEKPLPVWLPPGGAKMFADVEKVLELEEGFLEREYAVQEFDPDTTLQIGSLSLCFAPTRHFIPGYAIRCQAIGADESTLGFSSDTAFAQPLIEVMRDVRLALVEASLVSYPRGSGFQGHLTGEAAGEIAREAQVGRLLLTHYVVSAGEQVLQQARDAYGRDVELAEPGKSYTV